MSTFEASDVLDAGEGEPFSLDGLSIGSGRDQLYGKVATDVLPDEVLLHMFHFYVNRTPVGDAWRTLDAWHTLIHVCQRWRYVTLASPKRLNHHLLCNHGRLITLLDVWPSSLPIVVSDSGLRMAGLGLGGAEIIFAALEHSDRISTIDLKDVPTQLWKTFLAMTGSFPVLTSLRFHTWDRNFRVLPGSCSGGSFPRLQELHLEGIPFPGLGKLLLSTSDLTDLRLDKIPHTGYIAPEAIITSLSALTKLESFELGFRSPQSRARRASQPSPTVTRVVLATLTRLQFRGDSAYLEEIVSRVDAPLLQTFTTIIFDCLVFDTPQLRHFISHTESFTALNRADVIFDSDDSDISVTFSTPDGPGSPDRGALTLGVLYTGSGPGFISLVRLCSSSLPLLPTLKRLSTRRHLSSREPHTSVTEWVEFLRIFTFVKDLDLSGNLKLVKFFLAALRELAGERVIETLPALQNIFLSALWPSGNMMKVIEPFVTARQISGRPVAIRYSKRGDSKCDLLVYSLFFSP